MLTKEKIERINVLARKQKSEGLTSAEKSEQEILRREYIDAFKGNLRVQLDCISTPEQNASSCGCNHDHDTHKHSSTCNCGSGCSCNDKHSH